MDKEASELLLKILIDNSNRILDPGFGLDHCEPTFLQIVNLLSNNEKLKTVFLKRVDATLRLNDPMLPHGDDYTPIELIEFVAYDLRWTEIKVIAEERIHKKFNDDKTAALGDPASNILDVFSDNWSSREFYAVYR